MNHRQKYISRVYWHKLA